MAALAIAVGALAQPATADHTASVTVLTSGTAAAPTGEVVSSAFIDTPTDHRFAAAVEWLANHGVANGTGNGRFEPGGTVTRGQMAAFLWRYAGAPGGAPAVDFVDVAPDAWNAQAIAFLAAEGITRGIDADRFGGNRPITRAQMATFLWRLQGSPIAPKAGAASDVADDNVHAPAIAWLAAEGITTGVDGDRFAPGNPVTRGQMAALLWRSAGQPALHEPPPGLPRGEDDESADQPAVEEPSGSPSDGGDDVAAPAPGPAPAPAPAPAPGPSPDPDPVLPAVSALCELQPVVEQLLGRSVTVDRGEADYALDLDYSLRHACLFSDGDAEALYLSRWPDDRDDPGDTAGSITVDAGDRAWVVRRADTGSFLTVQLDGHTLYLRAPLAVIDVAHAGDQSTFASWGSTLAEASLPFEP